MLKAKFKLKLDRRGVMRAIENKRKRVLTKTGAYAMGVMRNMIKGRSKAKKSRTVVVSGVQCFVPVRGMVLDARTKRPVSKELALAARKALAAQHRSEGAGQPPKRGPKDTLRKNVIFAVEGESVV